MPIGLFCFFLTFFIHLHNLLANIFQGIYGVFYQIIIEFQKMIINFKDVFNKISAMSTTLYYT